MPERFARRRLDDEEIWLDLRDDRFLALNETAASLLAAWRDGVRDDGALAAHLVARFDVDLATARAAVTAFLPDARARGLLDA